MTCKKLALTLLLSVATLSGRAFANVQAPHDLAHGVTCNSCHIPSGSLTDPAHLVTGTATGGSTTSILDSSKTWTTGAWISGVVTFTSGSNLGQFRHVTDLGRRSSSAGRQRRYI